jgi:signal transduction histidine kinase
MVLSSQLVGSVQLLAGLVALLFLKPGVDNADAPGSTGYAVFTVGTALWMFGLGVPKFIVDYTFVVSSYHVQILGTELAAAGWLLLALAVSDRTDLLGRVAVGLGGGIVCFQLLLWTNPVHHIMYGPGPGVVDGGIVRDQEAAVAANFGWWWIHTAASYLCALTGEAILVASAVGSSGVRRKQFGWLSLMAIPILPASVISTFGLFELPYNITSVGFLLAVPIIAVVLFRARFLDVVPIARQTVMAEMDAAMVTLDGEDRVVDANRRARELFASESASLGTPAEEFFTSGADEVLSELTQTDAVDTEVTVPLEGQQRHFSVVTSPVGDGPARGRAVLFSDITAQKRREQELEETKRSLEQSNEKLEQFAGVVSHDLRNPLTAAQLGFELIREDAPEEPAAVVEHNLERMEAMIDDLLTLARAGQTIEEPEPVALADTAREAWTNSSVGESEFRSSIPVGTRVRADRTRLLHAFENLFSNAAEHNDPPPTVHVGLMEDPELSSDEGRETGFFVEDDGEGIPEEERADVFEDGYTTRENGTGFGLSIVEEVVRAHGWKVRVTEGDDGGARFEITGIQRSS